MLVRRIIGLPGDRVSLDRTTGQVTVNGQPLTENYVSCLAVGNMDIADETLVPAGEVFVLGDERLTALDSRRQKHWHAAGGNAAGEGVAAPVAPGMRGQGSMTQGENSSNRALFAGSPLDNPCRHRVYCKGCFVVRRGTVPRWDRTRNLHNGIAKEC